ncbi:MAG TPA: DUF4384 domain-containing protein [Pyrinomonadaceae bacterium]|jgi:hypothetical protein
MRYKLFLPKLLFAALSAICAPHVARACAQEAQGAQPAAQDEGIVTRGAFLTTRKKSAGREGKTASGEAAAAVTIPAKRNDPSSTASNSPGKAKKGNGKSLASAKTKMSAPKNGNAPAREENAREKNSVEKNSDGANANVAYSEAASNPRPIGLGYTLFTLGDNGEAVRTDPTRQFRTGEGIRIALETNTDGYLYIFHTENDGEPSMIFPDVRLDGGSNLVKAHVPYEIPSSREATEAMRWFVFTDPPAAERLYIVLTRQPLANVPAGEALASYCLDKAHSCPWRPAAATWTELKGAQEREQVAVSRVADQGRTQTADEREATTRGLGLGVGAPSPSVIRMTASSNSKMLVTTIDLIHK